MEKPHKVPFWFYISFWFTCIGCWILAFVVSALAYAWRFTEPAWILPTVLTVEALALVAMIAGFRRSESWLIDLSYSCLSSWRAFSVFVVIALVAIGWLYPLWGGNIGKVQPIRNSSKKIAVVGAGAAGVHAAWALYQGGVNFDLYEATEYVGGHAYSPTFKTADGRSFPVDIGFIFGAPTSYWEMKALMAWHEIARRPTSLSMYAEVGDVTWETGSADFPPDIERFHKLADEYRDNAALEMVPFGLWLSWHGFDEHFRLHYLNPLMSVLFITIKGLYEQSTRFMLNMTSGANKWVDFQKPSQAWVVDGGSFRYYQAIISSFRERVLLSSPVTSVKRRDGRVEITSIDPRGSVKKEMLMVQFWLFRQTLPIGFCLTLRGLSHLYWVKFDMNRP